MDIFRLNDYYSQYIHNSALKRPRTTKVDPCILPRKKPFPFLEERR